jgi:riboflavin kinase/FMN adenylyltransferase
MPVVVNIGHRPTVDPSIQTPKVEAHVLDFKNNPTELYGAHVGLYLTQFIRPEKKFASIEELKTNISSDSKNASSILKKSGYI